MAQSWKRRFWRLKLVSALITGVLMELCVGVAGLFTKNALAQLNLKPDSARDRNLGTTVVPLTPKTDLITGGIRPQNGSNLFHSFQEFNISEGRGVYFDNPAGVTNILSRVTGNDPSDILGMLGVKGGSANLFLINPKGIIFGPNASLDVNGSFVATTANAIQFGSQGFFSTSAPNVPPLLTVNPSAFLFNQMAAQSITVNSRRVIGFDDFLGLPIYEGLKVPDSKSLLVLGGDVRLEGGILLAPGGRIELGGAAGAGTVGLDVNGNNLSLNFPQAVQRADVILNDDADVNTRAGNGGSIAIDAQNLSLAGASSVRTGIGSGLGSVDSRAGDIEIDTTGAISLADGSFISNAVLFGAVGQGGDINITARSLSMTNQASVVTSNLQGQGNAGNITITARDTVSVTDRAFLSTTTVSGQGDAGDITIIAGDAVSLDQESFVTSDVEGGVGNSGNINIKAGSLSFTNGVFLSTSILGQGKGNAGSINIDIRDTASFDGVRNNGLPSGAFSGTEAGTEGNSGNINIKAGSLSFTNGASLSVNIFGQGDAGSININARDTVSFDGVGAADPSQASSGVGAGAKGDGGDINITARSIFFTNNAQLIVDTEGQGNAGNVNINARDIVSFDGAESNELNELPGGIFSQVAEKAVGKGGSVNITTGTLSVTNGAQLNASSEGNGPAGSLDISASSIRLSNESALSSDTIAGQGNIFLDSQNLILRRGSTITTNAQGTAIGGNITIDSSVIAALENSDISANAEAAFGGQVEIDAQGIFGTEFRNQPTLESDITASSDLGPQFSGSVEINTPDVDPSKGVVTLPDVLVNVEVAQGCQTGSKQQASVEFFNTGRGGLAPSPYEPLSSSGIWEDVPRGAETPSAEALPEKIVEAQGWLINEKGEAILVAEVPTHYSQRRCRLR